MMLTRASIIEIVRDHSNPGFILEISRKDELIRGEQTEVMKRHDDKIVFRKANKITWEEFE